MCSKGCGRHTFRRGDHVCATCRPSKRGVNLKTHASVLRSAHALTKVTGRIRTKTAAKDIIEKAARLATERAEKAEQQETESVSKLEEARANACAWEAKAVEAEATVSQMAKELEKAKDMQPKTPEGRRAKIPPRTHAPTDLLGRKAVQPFVSAEQEEASVWHRQMQHALTLPAAHPIAGEKVRLLKRNLESQTVREQLIQTHGFQSATAILSAAFGLAEQHAQLLCKPNVPPAVAVDAVVLIAEALCADNGKTAISGRKDSKGLVEQMLGIKPLLS